MKRYTTLILWAICLMALTWGISLGFSRETALSPLTDLEFAIVSDVHVMDPSLLVNPGEALDDYLRHDRKMLLESPAITTELTRRLLETRPQLVLLTGDLTKDGEAVSHAYVRQHLLEPLRQAGIQVLVIPGNHDINNPHAVAYDGDSCRRVPTFSPEEFAAFYSDYGYGGALARDTASLSYTFAVSPQLRVLAIDACCYDENDFDRNICRHEGRIRPQTLEWIRRQLADARKQGVYVIGMMHHGLMEHWSMQDEVIPGYVVDHSRSVRRVLAQEGLEVVFTGHAHTQDVARSHGLWDVETGSTVSYPLPYRTVELHGSAMQVHSHHLDSIDYDTHGLPLQDYARASTAQGFRSLVSEFLPEAVPQDLRDRILAFGAELMCDNYRGDERLTAARADTIRALSRQLRRYSLRWGLLFDRVAHSVLNDRGPADNDLLIPLRRR